MMRIWSGLLFFVVIVCSCAPSKNQGQVVSTQILVEPNLTETPIPDTPTVTFTPLPRVEDLLIATPVVLTLPPLVSSDPVVNIDPVASELVALAQQRLSQELNLPVRRIRLKTVAPYIWVDTSLGCPLPGESYPAASIDGYRIILSVDDQEYIFHTDFDRVTACEAANEKLPSSVPG